MKYKFRVCLLAHHVNIYRHISIDLNPTRALYYRKPKVIKREAKRIFLNRNPSRREYQIQWIKLVDLK